MTESSQLPQRNTLDFTGLGCLLGGFVFAVGYAVMIAATRAAPAWFPSRTITWPILLAVCFAIQARFVAYTWDSQKPSAWNDDDRDRDTRRARRIRRIAMLAAAVGLTELLYGFELIAHHDAAWILRTAWLALGVLFVVMHVTWTSRAVHRPAGDDAERMRRALRIDGVLVAGVLAVLLLFLTPASIYRFVWQHEAALAKLCDGDREGFADWPLSDTHRWTNIGPGIGRAEFAWTEWSVLTLVHAPNGLPVARAADTRMPRALFGPWHYSIDD